MTTSRLYQDEVEQFQTWYIRQALDSCTSFTGPVVNPHNEKRMALGSSSGCAALVSVIVSIYFLARLPCFVPGEYNIYFC